MRRLALAACGALAVVLLSSCGSASLTVKVASPAASVVVVSDSDAIAALKTKVQQLFSSGSTGSTVVDGDQHSGNHVCGFNRSKNGHSYQVDVYGSAQANTCNNAAQQQFLSNVP
jgi:hypothetical protein